jgi:hypothetical protein
MEKGEKIQSDTGGQGQIEGENNNNKKASEARSGEVGEGGQVRGGAAAEHAKRGAIIMPL